MWVAFFSSLIFAFMKLPKDFTLRMQKRLPQEEFDHFIAAYNQETLPVIRLNPVKYFTEDLPGVPWFENGKYLKERKRFITDPLWHAGAYYVQEPSSMILGYIYSQLYKEYAPKRALDLCAAPGGKSTLLQSLLPSESVLVANEVIKSRVQILKENHMRLGMSDHLLITQNDPRDFKKLVGYFDYMQVDAPCSGEGMFRKDTVAEREWSLANCQLCSERSERILNDILPALSKNGYLVYSTCTFNPDENEHLLHKISQNHSIESIAFNFPADWGITEVEHHGIYGYYFYPHKVQGEGLFVSVFRKLDGEEFKAIQLPKKNKSTEVKELISSEDIQQKESTYHWKSPVLTGTEKDLQKYLNIIYAGIELGEQKGKNFIPSQALANYHKKLHYFNSVEVDENQALAFLRGNDPNLTLDQKGFYLLTYQGLGLGFIKYLGNRSNNYYPKPWRIKQY